jgi:DNA polymerase-3 subunit alpha
MAINWKKLKFYNHHLHSHYSVMDCVTKPEELVKMLKDRGHKHVTITEHGTLASTYELWKECGKHDMTPILGNEAYYVDSYEDDACEVAWNYGHIIIMCMNETGWKNLKKLHHISWEQGYKAKPRIQLTDLCKHNEGLMITTGCMRGPVGYDYLGNDKFYGELPLKERKKRIYKRMRKLKKAFGDRFYCEIQLLELPEQIKLNKFILKLAAKYKMEVIVTGDCHYLHEHDTDIHDAMICIGRKEQLDDENNTTYPTNQLWLKTALDIRKAWSKWHKKLCTERQLAKYVRNTVTLAERVERYPIRPETSSLPKFCDNPRKLVNDICWEHREANNILDNDEYWERYQYELEVIDRLGYLDYFLVVWDFTVFARANDIPYNARGSVCGSLIAYLMGITWIDPLIFDLPFERFLTDDRVSLPDIDMDFSSLRRDEMIRYAEEKYGKECVVHICNYLKWKPKQAFKDVGRVLGYDFQTLNNITRKVEDNVKDWEDFAKVASVRRFLEVNEDIQPIAERMLGVVRQQGIHASGVVVTPGPCVEWLPIAYRTDSNKRWVKVTEWDMYALEDLDILKLDFLGLNHLDIVAHAINLIKKRHTVPFANLDDLYTCLFREGCSDEKVYQAIWKQYTVGTFQLGTSDGMRQLGSDLKPDNIHEVNAMIALYRTAVLEAGMHTEFVKRKFGKEYEYLHPKMGEALDDTRGVLLYQEQTSKLAIVLAGFTAKESDHFRKGIKLKDKKKFAVWKDKFIKGCKKHNDIDKGTAKQIWGYIEKFSGYGFNRAHSATYGVFAYLTVWLKVHYHTEYMTALLSCNMDDDEKLYKYILDMQKEDIKILPPSINNSQDTFTIGKAGILYPLQAVKQVGEKAVQAILIERQENGRYKSFDDFYNRVPKRIVNVGVIINLILSGAFRKFGTREEIFDELMDMRQDSVIRQLYCNECKRRYPISKDIKVIQDEGVLCPNCSDTEIEVFKYGRMSEDLRKHKFDRKYIKRHVFGFSIQECQLKQYADIIRSEHCHPLEYVEMIEENNSMRTALEIRKIKRHQCKDGSIMAFVDITDGKYESSIVVFSREWSTLQEQLKEGDCYIAELTKNRGKFMYSSYKGSFFKKLRKSYKGK